MLIVKLVKIRWIVANLVMPGKAAGHSTQLFEATSSLIYEPTDTDSNFGITHFVTVTREGGLWQPECMTRECRYFREEEPSRDAFLGSHRSYVRFSVVNGSNHL